MFLVKIKRVKQHFYQHRNFLHSLSLIYFARLTKVKTDFMKWADKQDDKDRHTPIYAPFVFAFADIYTYNFIHRNIPYIHGSFIYKNKEKLLN